MAQEDLFSAPAGWYPDPLGLPQLRWWNNHAWTEQTSAARQPMVMQDTKFAWADDEPVAAETQSDGIRDTVPEAEPVAPSLGELEPPRSFTKVEQQPPVGEKAPEPEASSASGADQEQKWWSSPSEQQESRRHAERLNVEFIAPEPVAPEPVAQQEPAAAPSFDFAAHFGMGQSTAPQQPAAQQASTGFEQSSYAGNQGAYQVPQRDFAEEALDAIFGAPTRSRPRTAPTADSLAYETSAPRREFADEALDAIFGAHTLAPRSAPMRTPIIPAEDVAPVTVTVGEKRVLTATGAVWAIALIPLVQLVIAVMLVNSLLPGDNSVLFYATLAAGYLATVVLAFVDYRLLTAAGNTRPAHWAFALLSAPVYLVLRARSTVRESGRGFGPILVWAGDSVLAAAAVLVIPGLIIAPLPAVFTGQIEQSIVAEAAVIGVDMTADCPVAPPLLPGQEIFCTTTSAGGVGRVIVTLERSNGWIGWRVIDWGKYSLGTTATE